MDGAARDVRGANTYPTRYAVISNWAMVSTVSIDDGCVWCVVVVVVVVGHGRASPSSSRREDADADVEDATWNLRAERSLSASMALTAETSATGGTARVY